MKLTKEDYMRLPKERLAEIIVEMQDEKERIQFVPIPSPAIPNTAPWTEPFGPHITYAQNPNTPIK